MRRPKSIAYEIFIPRSGEVVHTRYLEPNGVKEHHALEGVHEPYDISPKLAIYVLHVMRTNTSVDLLSDFLPLNSKIELFPSNCNNKFPPPRW